MTRTIRALAVTLATVTAVASANAQSIASRVSAVRNGMVRMSFTSRPDVCGHGNGISTGRNRGQTITWDNQRSRDVEWEFECETGPVRVVLDIDDGQITGLRSYVGGKWRTVSEPVTDLGMVPASEAATYLVSLAENSRNKVGEKAIFPATIADSSNIWPALIRVARNTGVPLSTRRQAIFWLGQAAGDAATANLRDIVTDNSMEREVREQAIFALSQRPRSEGVPALLEVAKTNRDPQLRKKAMFWLGQSGDPRAIALFEEILTKQ